MTHMIQHHNSKRRYFNISEITYFYVDVDKEDNPIRETKEYINPEIIHKDSYQLTIFFNSGNFSEEHFLTLKELDERIEFLLLLTS